MVEYSLDQGLFLILWQENRSLECHGGRSSTSHNSVGSYDRIVDSTVVHNLVLGPILDRYRNTVYPAIDEWEFPLRVHSTRLHGCSMLPRDRMEFLPRRGFSPVLWQENRLLGYREFPSNTSRTSAESCDRTADSIVVRI